MIKRTTLVWKRSDLSIEDFRRLWLEEHAEHAKRLAGLREYVIDFVTEGPQEAPQGIATLRFDSREALEAAFSDSQLREDLVRTRQAFAASVEVMIVDEHVVVGGSTKALT